MNTAMDSFATWDAVETAEQLAKKNVSPREVMEAAIRRAEAVGPLGAFVTPTFERALDETKSLRPGAFSGVPSALKDLVQQRGTPTSFGSRGGAKFPAPKNEKWVDAFEGLGFISLGKTATPELGLTATTEAVGFAACRNPWDPTRSSGGSSGGAAVLDSSGVIPLAHGSDGGGSIRIPAAACGLVGLKPTRGRFDMEGSNTLPVNVAVQGVLSRTVRDTVAFWNAMSPVLPRTRLPRMTPVANAPKKTLRIGISTAVPRVTVDPEHVEAVNTVAKTLEALGHTVEQVPHTIDEQFMDDFLRYWSVVAFLQSSTMKYVAQKGFNQSLYDVWTSELVRRFHAARLDNVKATLRLRKFHQRFLAQFQKVDVLLTPTLAQPPPKLGYLSPDVESRAQFERLSQYVPFTPAYNASGAPAISLPLARTKEGLPIGLQFGADMGQEAMLLTLAAELEEALPWPHVAPAK
ncbi:MAG: amidase [Archangium sp.]